jgi:hypothetical protein
LSLIDAGGDIYVGVCNRGKSLFCLLVGEMRDEELVLSAICAFFECWRCGDGNKFVVSVDMVLWELEVMEIVY